MSGKPLRSEWDPYAMPEDLQLVKPKDLGRTKFCFRWLDERLVYQLHNLGLGCIECPLRDGRRDCGNCKLERDGEDPMWRM